MQFSSPASHYDRFMGRYSRPLASVLVDVAGVASGQRVLDVGCGPGALTEHLVARVGAGNVAAIDPAPLFVQACRERHPGADVREGVAEDLPWPDASFDAAMSCLVIGFMRDPDGGVRELVRITKPGGTVAACMWDIATGGMTMLRTFWDAVRTLDPSAAGERPLAGTAEGDIAQRFRRAGLDEVSAGSLTVDAEYADFDDFWVPFTLSVGPAGEYVQSLSASERSHLRDLCRAELPASAGPFRLDARAWYATGVVAPD